MFFNLKICEKGTQVQSVLISKKGLQCKALQTLLFAVMRKYEARGARI